MKINKKMPPRSILLGIIFVALVSASIAFAASQSDFIPPPPDGPIQNVSPSPPSATQYIYTPPQPPQPLRPISAPPPQSDDYRMKYPWFFSSRLPTDESPEEIPVDFAVVAVSKSRLTTEDKKEGVLVPFVIDNRTDKEYSTDIELVCSDFTWQKNFLFKKGKTRTSLFAPFQDSATGDYEEMQRFGRGEKAENCSLHIARVLHEDFFDDAGPADADITNNAFRFTLVRRNKQLIVSDLRRDQNNISEKTRKLKAPLSEEERQVYKNLSQEKCLNILISSSDRGTYYNGKPLDEKPEEFGPWIKLNNVHIAGDRLGYIDGTEVYVDDKYVGEINEVDRFYAGNEYDLYLNEKHYAYARKTDFDNKNSMATHHLIFDGKDLGETGTFGITLNGDYIIYPSSTFAINRVGGRENVKHFINVNGKRKAEGFNADYDGTNFIYHDSDKKKGFMLNGKSLGFGGDGVLKDGHTAYILGKTENVIDPHVFLDGKDLGPGRQPVIEGDHIAFLVAPFDLDKSSTDIYPNVIYDGKMLGKVSGAGSKIDLAGDHIAYVRRLGKGEEPFEYSKDFYRITIDGKDYPGEFFSGRVYVEIEEKQDRSLCR